MLSSPVCDFAPELQTSEIPEGFLKHAVLRNSFTSRINFRKFGILHEIGIGAYWLIIFVRNVGRTRRGAVGQIPIEPIGFPVLYSLIRTLNVRSEKV
jgi:hypothetical protein